MLKYNFIIIDRWGKDNDIILLEGNKDKCFTKLSAHPDIDLYSWDNQDLVIKSEKIIKELLELRNEKLQQEKFSNHLKVSELDEKMHKLFDQVFVYKCERDQSLINSIKDYLNRFPKSKIFVIAGRAHLTEEGESIAIDSTYNILDHLPLHEKCALVIPKINQSDNRIDIYDYLNEQVNSFATDNDFNVGCQ